jgi:hypothetical protein
VISRCEIDDDEDIYEIFVTKDEGKNKALNTNKNFQLLDVSSDLKNFVKNDKKEIEYIHS